MRALLIALAEELYGVRAGCLVHSMPGAPLWTMQVRIEGLAPERRVLVEATAHGPTPEDAIAEAEWRLFDQLVLDVRAKRSGKEAA